MQAETILKLHNLAEKKNASIHFSIHPNEASAHAFRLGDELLIWPRLCFISLLYFSSNASCLVLLHFPPWHFDPHVTSGGEC